jgi:hypothetical protein
LFVTDDVLVEERGSWALIVEGRKEEKGREGRQGKRRVGGSAKKK